MQHIENDDGSRHSRLIFALRGGRAKGVNHHCNLFQILDLCEETGVEVGKAYYHTFANGVSTYSIYSKEPVEDSAWSNLRTKVNLVFNLPEHTFLDGYQRSGKISIEEKFYLYSAARFAFYFMYQWNEDFEHLYKEMEGNVSQQSKLLNLKSNLDRENVKMEAIKETLDRNTDLAKLLYADFHSRVTGKGGLGIKEKLHVADPNDAALLNTFRKFNESVLKTNFFKEKIGAVGYRLDPAVFMGVLKVPEIPFGIFHIIGRDFNGFHVRFRDISRGGIRMIFSTPDNYERNKMT